MCDRHYGVLPPPAPVPKQVQAMAQGMVEELFVKLVALCDQDEKIASGKKKGAGQAKGR